MIEYIIWLVSFITLYLTIVLLTIFLTEDQAEDDSEKKYPMVTVVIPGYNESENVKDTIISAINSNYPPDKMKIIVIDDGSSDDTLDVMKKTVKEFRKKHEIKIIHQKNQGKAAALNNVLKKCDTELFACLDADSIVDKDALLYAVQNFNDAKTAGVVTAIRIYEPKNAYEKLQRMEYIMTIMARKIMTMMDTLHVTPGVLSIYRTEVLKNVGGFDNGNITEDFEIALRLRHHGYSIKLESKALTYTKAPNNFKSLWDQRVRWYRGFIQNSIKYKDLFFNSKYGFLGYFQFPVNVVGVMILLFSLLFTIYTFIDHIIETTIRSLTIKGYFISLFYVPTLKKFILTQNFKIVFPLFIASILGLYMFYLAHKQVKEKITYPFSVWIYLFIYPFLTCAHWITAIFHETFKTRRKW